MAAKSTLTPSTINLVKAYGRDITSRGINWDPLASAIRQHGIKV